MTVLADSQRTGAVQAAERLLAARAGSPVSLAEPYDLGGSGRTQVLRVRVAQNPFSADRTLVIKVLGAGETGSGDSFYREVASYKYANALPTESRPGPALIAFDLATRVLVLTDLGDGRSMTELLSGNDTAAVGSSLSAWGQALGRMHAATVGGENDFAALLRQGGDGVATDALRSQFAAAVSIGAQGGTVICSVRTSIRLSSNALEAARDLFAEGEHRAFSPSDVGPENILINDDGVRFLDYEWGGFRDATLDIAYALVTFAPWLTPSSAADRVDLETLMLDAWRSEVQAIWPSSGLRPRTGAQGRARPAGVGVAVHDVDAAGRRRRRGSCRRSPRTGVEHVRSARDRGPVVRAGCCRPAGRRARSGRFRGVGRSGAGFVLAALTPHSHDH